MSATHIPAIHLNFQPLSAARIFERTAEIFLCIDDSRLSSLTMQVDTGYPASKRHGMLFRRQPHAQQDMITAQFPNPKTGHISPGNVSFISHRTPQTQDEALFISCASTPPPPPPHLVPLNSTSHPIKQPLERSRSSEYYLEIKKTPGAKEQPRSQRKDYRTIRTDATATQPAFESDAFAIQMPTTREPILEQPVFRAKIPNPSKAQVDAYQQYKQKAQQVRERNTSEGVRVPSKIMSYDYAYKTNERDAPLEVEVNQLPPASPPRMSPAGSFPASPPMTQSTWAAALSSPPKQQSFSSRRERGSQSTQSTTRSSNSSIAERSATSSNTTPSKSPHTNRSDVGSGASASPTRAQPKIKIRIVPKAGATTQIPSQPPSQPAPDPPIPPPKESWWPLSSRTAQSSVTTSRSPSPTKSAKSNNLHFDHTTSASENVAAANDTIFGFTTGTISGTTAGAAKHDAATTAAVAAATAAAKKKPEQPKRSLTSRWAWLRPIGPRVAKPTAAPAPAPAPTAPTAPPPPAATTSSSYIDPFTRHATPPASRPTSPNKKLVRPSAPLPASTPASASAVSATAKGKFESGFAQIIRLFTLLLKLCILVYTLVAIYFVLDAVREAVHALGAPFRAGRVVGGVVWMGMGWVGRGMKGVWERAGVRVVVRAGRG